MLSRAQVLRRLRQLSGLTHASAHDLPSPLYRALLFHFGGIHDARRAAGLPAPRRTRRWTEATLLAELRRVHRIGIPIRHRDLYEAGRQDLTSAIAKLVGGLRRARRLAGIPTQKRIPRAAEPWDQERVIEEIRERQASDESLASSKAPGHLVAAGLRHFGNWRAAIEAAGLDYEAICLRTPAWTDSALLAKIRTFARRYPDARIADLEKQPWFSTLASRAGSQAQACALAGIRGWPRRQRTRLPDMADTLAAIRARRHARKPVYDQAVRRDDVRLLEAGRRHFGTWRNALEAAGVANDSPRSRGRWTREDILAALQARKRAGQSLKSSVVRREHPGLWYGASRVFGSYLAVAAPFGAKPAQITWTRAKVVAGLQQLAKDGVLLTSRGIRTAAGASLEHACVRQFGSVSAARRAAGL